MHVLSLHELSVQDARRLTRQCCSRGHCCACSRPRRNPAHCFIALSSALEVFYDPGQSTLGGTSAVQPQQHRPRCHMLEMMVWTCKSQSPRRPHSPGQWRPQPMDQSPARQAASTLAPAPHEPVAEVVDVPRDAPPAGHQQPAAARGGQAAQVAHAGRARVAPERVLLRVGAAEHRVAERLERQDARHRRRRQLLRGARARRLFSACMRCRQSGRARPTPDACPGAACAV
jgi:hypothetical protein